MRHDPRFDALNRELALATSVICIGLTAIRRTDFASLGTYTQAFFNLSIGLERLAKLVFILDHCVGTSGRFPTNDDLKKCFGHDLRKLMGVARSIRAKFPTDDPLARYPDDPITDAAIACLSEFADATRYYNLDRLVGGKSASRSDPIAQWAASVNEPILAKHFARVRKARSSQQAEQLASLLDQFCLVRFSSECGEPISNVADMLQASDRAKVAQKWSYVYVVRVVRFLAILLCDLQYASIDKGLDFVPFVGDHLGMFRNNDAYLKSRKAWGR